MSDYRYTVIVVNNNFGKKKLNGKIFVEVEGSLNGELKTIAVKTGESNSQSLLFKYFQRVDGLITIPEGFIPQRLHFTARLTGKNSEKKEKWYDWKILLNKGLPIDSLKVGSQ